MFGDFPLNEPPHKESVIYKIDDEHMPSSMMCQSGHNKSLLETIVPQLDKYLNLWHSQELFCIRKSVVLSPQIDVNFRHLFGKLWHCMYSVFMMCNNLFILQELLISKTFFEQEIT